MIQYHEDPENKINKIIKHRCKIKSEYYYIQIYTNLSQANERITFVIKSSTNKINSVLYKRKFYYDELLRYEKHFKYFNSLEDIFINISQCIQENKFTISNNIKYLSLTMNLYIKKRKKYSNVTVNLIKHKNLYALSVPKYNHKDIQKQRGGIHNEKELNVVITDIKKRLNKLEKSQNKIMMNNYNINNTNINSVTNSTYNMQDENKDSQFEFKDNKNMKDFKIYNITNAHDETIGELKIKDKNSNIYENKNFTYNNKNNYINTKNNRKNNYFNASNNNNNNSFNISKNNEFWQNDEINNNYLKTNNKHKPINRDNNENNNNFNEDLGDENIYPKPHDINNRNTSSYNRTENQNNSNLNTNNILGLNLDNINKEDLNSQKMIGINNILLEKLNKLENSINKKDIKLQNLENRLNNMTSSRNHISFKSKNKSGIYNNNYMISSINKTNGKMNTYKEYWKNSNNGPQKGRFINEFTQTNNGSSYILNNSKIDNIKDKERKKNLSVDYYNDSKYNDSISYSQNKEKRVDDDERGNERHKRHREHRKNGKKHHSLEKHKNENKLSLIKPKEIRRHNSIDKYDKGYSQLKVKSIEKTKNNKNINNSIDSKNINYKKFINKDNQTNSTYTEQDNTYKRDKDSNEDRKRIDTSRSYSKDKKRIKNIPIYPREKIKKYINSEIVYRKDELRLLKDTISNYNRKLHVFFDLLYRASKHGDKEIKIRDSIEDNLHTLTLFHTHEGARFGVYIRREESHVFMKDNLFKEVPGSCFIVGLNNLLIFQIYPNRTSNEYFRDILCFGRTILTNKNGSNWIINTPQNNFLNKKCIMGNGEILFDNFSVEELVGDEEYHLKEVEIFNVVIEKSDKKE